MRGLERGEEERESSDSPAALREDLGGDLSLFQDEELVAILALVNDGLPLLEPHSLQDVRDLGALRREHAAEERHLLEIL